MIYPKREERYAFVIDWLRSEFSADCLNADFHNAYAKRFPQYKRRQTYWGSSPVAKAMEDLRALQSQGLIYARRASIANWQKGFPKHNLTYSLT